MGIPEAISQLEQVWLSVETLCQACSEADFDTLTLCPGWTVKDQLSHIIGTESMLEGEPSPPQASKDIPWVRNRLGAINETWIERLRPISGPNVLALFNAITRRRLHALHALTDADYDALTPSPIGQIPYRELMEIRVMDCWIHEIDIRIALNRPGHLEGPAPRSALTRLLTTLDYVVGARIKPPDGTVVVVELEGPITLNRTITMAERRAAHVGGSTPNPTVRIAIDTMAYVKLASGRESYQPPHEGIRKIEGDVELAEAILRQCNAMP
ncbi:MAG: maleylpyruvate isomerase family mycothiol-dependent enzyme [Ferrimicrobium sp.]